MRKLMIASLLAVLCLGFWTAAFAGDRVEFTGKTYVGWSGWHEYSTWECCNPCFTACYKCCKPKCDPCCKPCKPCCKQEICTPVCCEPKLEKCCPAPVCEYPNACEEGLDEFDRNGISRQGA